MPKCIMGKTKLNILPALLSYYGHTCMHAVELYISFSPLRTRIGMGKLQQTACVFKSLGGNNVFYIYKGLLGDGGSPK